MPDKKDRTIKKIQDLRTIEMYGDQEKFLQKHYKELSRALEQVTQEAVDFLNGDLPGQKRLIKNLEERALTHQILSSQGKRVPVGVWSDQRMIRLVDEIDRWGKRVQKVTGKSVETSSVEMAKDVYKKYPPIFSLDGEIPGVEFLKPTIPQIEALVQGVIGGHTLEKYWLNNIFKTWTDVDIRNEMLVAALKGEGIPKITKRIRTKYPWLSQRQMDRIERQVKKRGLTGKQYTDAVTKRINRTVNNNAITLARTHMQEVSNAAMDSVFVENSDIIQGFEWNATLEPGYSKTGRGTCIRCASLDGTVYRKNEPRPDIPLHPNCRCIYTPVLKDWQELGIDADKVIQQNRGYAVRETDIEQAHGFGKSIGAGGRKTKKAGTTTITEYRKWYDERNATFQANVTGPSRAKWLKENPRRSLRQLVHKDTGKLKRLDQLPGNPDVITRKDYINRYGSKAEKELFQNT